jgi:aminocarboxymuconate-semialdehyde decarboxylase
MTVIDVHTHMMSEGWLRALREHGRPDYTVRKLRGGKRGILMGGAPFATLTAEMFDYNRRIKAMNKAGIDIAIVSLAAPSVYWANASVSTAAAQAINDDMARAQARHPKRIRFLATLPWQHPARALAELDRAMNLGAVGVMALANVGGMPHTHPRVQPIWRELDRRALPVLLHPTMPPGAAAMEMQRFGLASAIGYAFDTTLALTRMIFDGFFERHQRIKLIAAHGGGALPFLAGRLDRCFETMPECREKITAPPSTYLRRIHYDAVTHGRHALAATLDVVGAERVLFGSDYPSVLGDMAGALARVDALRAGARKAVRGANAERIFKL